jgi:hypothetical protein
MCVSSSHASNHGNTFLPNASFYLRTSSPLVLKGNGATGANASAREPSMLSHVDDMHSRHIISRHAHGVSPESPVTRT